MTTNPYPADSAEREDACPDIIYENKCLSDAFRLSKSSYVSGFVVCPVTETKVILLVSDGRLLIWNVKSTGESISDAMLMSDECLKASLPLAASDTPLISAMVSPPEKTLADILPPSMQQGGLKNSFRFLLVGLLSNVQASPNCAAMCPPMTTKNWPEYKPLVAVGKFTTFRLVLLKKNLLKSLFSFSFGVMLLNCVGESKFFLCSVYK